MMTQRNQPNDRDFLSGKTCKVSGRVCSKPYRTIDHAYTTPPTRKHSNTNAAWDLTPGSLHHLLLRPSPLHNHFSWLSANMSFQDDSALQFVKRQHPGLGTTFRGVMRLSEAPEMRVHQYLGIQYASIPARFRQSKVCTAYPPVVDATSHG